MSTDCPCCSYKTDRPYNLKVHMNRLHGGSPIPIVARKKSIAKQGTVEKALARIDDGPSLPADTPRISEVHFQCGECKVPTRSSQELLTHYQQLHRDAEHPFDLLEINIERDAVSDWLKELEERTNSRFSTRYLGNYNNDQLADDVEGDTSAQVESHTDPTAFDIPPLQATPEKDRKRQKIQKLRNSINALWYSVGECDDEALIDRMQKELDENLRLTMPSTSRTIAPSQQQIVPIRQASRNHQMQTKAAKRKLNP
ncbi:unnamed protein product, partial [Mesorhabditis spiculigera]